MGAARVVALAAVAAGAAMAAGLCPAAVASAATDSTLDAVTTELSRALGTGAGHVPEGAKVVAAAVVSDVPGTRGDELGARIAAGVAAHLVKASAEPRTGALSVGAAAASRSPALVYVSARIVAGKLEVTADVYPTVSNGWDRVRSRAPQPVGHAFASGRVDAEIRAFLPPILLEQATLHKAPLRLPPGSAEASEILALGCGDADGDGNVDLVLSTRAQVLVGRLRGGAFTVERAVAWKDLAPRSPAVLREPVAAFSFAPRFAAGTTDRGGVILGDDLRTAATFEGLPVGAGACVRLDADGVGFSGPASACEATARAGAAATVIKLPAARYDGAVVWTDVRRDGQSALVAAAREPNGKLHVGFDGTEEVIPGAGASFAVGDLDLDGVPEIVSGRNLAPASAGGAGEPGAEVDAVQIISLGAGGRPRLRFPAPAGVRAVAMCPSEARALPAAVAIVGDEVWLVR